MKHHCLNTHFLCSEQSALNDICMSGHTHTFFFFFLNCVIWKIWAWLLVYFLFISFFAPPLTALIIYWLVFSDLLSICSPSFPSSFCVPYLKSCYTEIIVTSSFSLHSLCTERSWNVLKLSNCWTKGNGCNIFSNPPLPPSAPQQLC